MPLNHERGKAEAGNRIGAKEKARLSPGFHVRTYAVQRARVRTWNTS